MMQMQLLPKKITRKLLIKIIAFLGVLLFPIIVLLLFFMQFNGRIYPNVVLAGENVGGMTPEEAAQKVSQSFLLPHSVTLTTDNQIKETHVIPTDSLNTKVNLEDSVKAAYAHGRSGSLLEDIPTIVNTISNGATFDPIIDIEVDQLEKQLAVYSESITTQPIEPTISVVNKEIVVSSGELGTEIDINSLKSEIINTLKAGNTQPIIVKVITVDPRLTEEQVLNAKLRAQKTIGKKFMLEFEHQSFEFSDDQLLSFIHPKQGYYNEKIADEVKLIASKINREAQNPVFTFTEGKVQEFKPAKDGVVLQEEKLVFMIIDSLEDLEKEEFDNIAYTVPVSSTPPAISMENVNDLGIKELIGRGTSQFKGSIPSRVYNIQLATSRLNGVLIKPGEEFSFNGALGDVSALTGYKQAYVIQGGRTVLGDGGGVCQVSTTFFRAALNTGLPVLERNPHSYRVGYYEQDSGPGLDASIYTPTLDLKIKNDTPGHILIQTIADTQNMTLVFELYGTSDGRTATVSKPIVTSQSAPPEPLYIDDPELPTGEIKQIDYAAWGAKAQFDYKVERNGETLIEKTFYSNYRPWQAKFLKGIGPAPTQ